MRKPKYLSPTSLLKWEADPEEFYLQYLADNRPPRIPQTQPMAVGSAFDAYIKSYFHDVLFGKGTNPQFALATIFEEQVEEQNRDWALGAGKHAFNSYQRSGAMADLLLQLQEAQGEPRFEFKLEKEIRGVPLLGKPDVYFIHKSGVPIILDFKVNGFCGNYNTSPKPGYLKCRDGWEGPHSRSHNEAHKKCQPMKHMGILINVGMFLEDVDKDWALQLASYAWLCGAEVGSDFIAAIDQLACQPFEPDCPRIRVAEHRCIVSKPYQLRCVARFSELWEIINSNHIFRNMSYSDSALRCQTLDNQYKAFEEGDDFLREMVGR
jgi:hypothetical protein